MNICTIFGHCTKTPELQYSQNKKAYMQIDMAVVADMPKSKNNGTGASENTNQTTETQPPEYIRLTAWGKRAERLNGHLQKGTALAASGSIHLNRYQAQDKSLRTNLELRNIKYIQPMVTLKGVDHAPNR